MFGQPFLESQDFISFKNVTEVIVDEYPELISDKNVLFSETTQSPQGNVEEILEETGSKSESVGSESRADWCVSHKTYDIGNRKEFERFKKFIKGTLGERYWWLWMDIERLKVLKDPGRHQRYFYFLYFSHFRNKLWNISLGHLSTGRKLEINIKM